MSGDVRPNARFEEIKSAYNVSPWYVMSGSLTQVCSRWITHPQIIYGRVALSSSQVSLRQMLAYSHTPHWSTQMRGIRWWVNSHSSTE